MQISILDTRGSLCGGPGSAFAVTYSIRFIHGVFFGPPPDRPAARPARAPFLMRFPMQLLVLACLIVGIVPGLTIGPFLHTAVTSVLGPATPQYSLAVWHGFTLPLMMSVTALVGGAILYLLLKTYLAHCEEGPPVFRRLKGQRIFERAMVTVSWRWARFVESQLGTRRLQPQLRLLVWVAFVAALWPLYSLGLDPGAGDMDGERPDLRRRSGRSASFCALGAACQAKFHRLAAMILLGGAGLVTCLTFVWLSAPDLALTQLLVEIVTTVLLLLGLRWLPKRFEDKSTRGRNLGSQLRRVRDLATAIAAGLACTLISYAVMTRMPPATIADYFLENAYSDGGGKNVVNVILVDFRGFDTFGEITVLGIVALTVFALCCAVSGPAPTASSRPEQQRVQKAFDEARPDREAGDTVSDYLLVPSVIMQWLFPVIIVLRRLSLPSRPRSSGRRLCRRRGDGGRLHPAIHGGGHRSGSKTGSGICRSTGSASACCSQPWSGMGSWLFGYPFLTSHSQYLELPLIGSVPAASATLFDLGVFSLVVGATVLMLIALGPPVDPPSSRLAHRRRGRSGIGGRVMELTLASPSVF